jgi:hypothetical protein
MNILPGSSYARTWFQKIRCMVFFHKLRVVQEFSGSTRKVYCSRCDSYFAMNDELRAFLPWDDEFEDLYANGWGLGRTNR